MFDYIKNKTVFANKYKTNSEAIIVSCFFNPQNSLFRVKAFKHFYDSIKHLNHQIIECIIGDAEPQLEENENIKRVFTENLLWHKEALLNNLIADLPKKYKYVFWVDGVKQLKNNNIIQPFEYCVHLEKYETSPSFDMQTLKETILPNNKNPKVWRSFCANYASSNLWKDENYNNHGHVGFAWGAKREILEAVPLYDRALIGGADHIIAHAAAGQIPHSCITKSFTDNLEEVNAWSERFYNVAQGKIGYVKGDLYHMWHGDINKRQYLKRIQDFTSKTKEIVYRDKNGLFITGNGEDQYIKDYFKYREVSEDDSFLTSMALGYMIGSIESINNPMLGELLNDDGQQKDEFGGFGGGDSGGAGAIGSWDDGSKNDVGQADIQTGDSHLQPF